MNSHSPCLSSWIFWEDDKGQSKISCSQYEYPGNIQSFPINSFTDEYGSIYFYYQSWVKIIYCKNHQWRTKVKLRCHLYYYELLFHHCILRLNAKYATSCRSEKNVHSFSWEMHNYLPSVFLFPSPSFGSNFCFVCFRNCSGSPPKQSPVWKNQSSSCIGLRSLLF